MISPFLNQVSFNLDFRMLSNILVKLIFFRWISNDFSHETDCNIVAYHVCTLMDFGKLSEIIMKYLFTFIIIIIIISAERRPLLDRGLPQSSPRRSVLCCLHPATSRDLYQIGPVLASVYLTRNNIKLFNLIPNCVFYLVCRWSRLHSQSFVLTLVSRRVDVREAAGRKNNCRVFITT
jgi:hypothetical protein